MFGSTCCVYYKLKKFFYLISVLMDSEILDQVTNPEKNVVSEVMKPRRGRKKKTNTKLNEVRENNIRDKRDRLITCVLSGSSKQYLGKEYTDQQINEMDSNNIMTLSDRYESVLSAQMTKSFVVSYGAFLVPVSVGIITGKHYVKNSGTKFNDRSDNGNCESATRNCNKIEEPSEN